jgi:hypothetical protein
MERAAAATQQTQASRDVLKTRASARAAGAPLGRARSAGFDLRSHEAAPEEGARAWGLAPAAWAGDVASEVADLHAEVASLRGERDLWEAERNSMLQLFKQAQVNSF